MCHARETQDIAETDDDELAALIYTAGTTGRSKGVMLTHGSLYANSKMSYESTRMPHGMTNITVLPLCHAYGIAVANSGLFYERTKSVILNTFDLETIFASIDQYEPRNWSRWAHDVCLHADVSQSQQALILRPRQILALPAPLLFHRFTWKQFR